MNTAASSARRFRKISDIARLINAGGDLNTILERIVYAICRHSEWSSCAIMHIDAEAGYSVLMQRFDPHAPERKPLADKWQLASSPAAKVALTGETLIIPDAQRSKDFPDYKKDAVVRGYHTVVILPLSVHDSAGRRLILAVQSREVVEVTRPELEFLKTVSDLAAIAVEKTIRLQQERAANARLQQTTALHTQLMEQILCGESPAAVCNMLEKLLRHPWLVIDLTARVIYAGGGSPLKNLSAKRWQEAVRGDAGRGFFDAARNAQRAQFREPAGLDFKHGETSFTLTALLEPLQVDGETMGALLLAPGESAFDEFDRLTAETVVLALSVQLMRGYIRFRTEATSRTDILSRLFSGDWRSTEGFAARALDLGIDTSVPCRLIGFAFLDADRANAGLTIEYAHRCISGLVDKLFAGAVTVQQGGEIIVLMPADEKRGRQWERLKQRLLEDVKQALGSKPIVFCAGVCGKPEDYAPARRECGRMLKLARAFKRTGLVSENDFNSTAVLLSVAENRAVHQFLNGKIIPIGDYDKAHGSKYLVTLKTFVESEGRFEHCAKTLGIHVSTLRYRLQRISDLFGIAARDPESRFDLLLAVKLYDLAAIAETK